MNTTHQTLRDTKSNLKDLLDTKYRYSRLYNPRATFDNFNRTKYKNSNNNIFTLNNNNTIKNLTTIPINYDEFIYTDKLTKKKIIIREALTSYSKGKSIKRSIVASQKNIQFS